MKVAAAVIVVVVVVARSKVGCNKACLQLMSRTGKECVL